MHFYKAAKVLPIESAPLPMYYCMLNAVKAYMLFQCKDFSDVKDNLNCHGIFESKSENESKNIFAKKLENIYVERSEHGVFTTFSKMLDPEFSNKWTPKSNQKKSLKELMKQLAFIHRAYISTFELPRKEELFIPIQLKESPTFYYCADNKIHLYFKLQKTFFRSDAKFLPDDIVNSLSDDLLYDKSSPFDIFSKEIAGKDEIENVYSKYRNLFSYVYSEQRIWYLKKSQINGAKVNYFNELTLIFAITHRLSEIVRYKPEQMIALLSGKENWLVHEFLSLALDQFIDEIACEITKHEIMVPRHK